VHAVLGTCWLLLLVAPEGRFVYLPLAMAAIFAIALLLPVLWRRSAAARGRFMAATALPLLDPFAAWLRELPMT